VAGLVCTLLPHLQHPEETVAAAFLHDVLEDHWETWSRAQLEDRFGADIAGAVWTLSKKSGKLVKPLDEYYAALAECSIGSVVKPGDRAHNLQTMHGVFDFRKQREYVGDVDRHYFPMIRTARQRFPRQQGAYDNLRILLECQREMVHRVLEASGVQVEAVPA
jgi:(p)ppGpp synthase/HD superfamily hydrolase